MCEARECNNVCLFLTDPTTIPNSAYDFVGKCHNDPITVDNPIYGARVDDLL